MYIQSFAELSANIIEPCYAFKHEQLFNDQI
jgi:hypothetical protein